LEERTIFDIHFIEAILTKDSNITSAIMFGRSKFHAGVIITPSPNHVFDPQDDRKLAEYRALIWYTVFFVSFQ